MIYYNDNIWHDICEYKFNKLKSNIYSKPRILIFTNRSLK